MEEVLSLREEKEITTECKTCVFAEYEEVSNERLSQTGCLLKRLDKLEKNGAQILHVKDNEGDR
ncbi:uncharacterized protein METZ01_LOCUS333277, partial [marine metagenome]